uniref:Phospholipase-like protein n=1 Tax=Tanacetum cinerariifolium TaxID=118510 RepID=A0A6L2M3D1_TANCI|nr:hypothetical protein [Tanacetum cinerariifolium]
MLGRQIDNENDDDENVSLYYHINKYVSIPFEREEFCLVTGLRFGVQNWAEYDTKERIPFRRRVFPSYLDGQPITGIDIANMIVDQSFAQLYDDDAVSLCCLGILQLVILGMQTSNVGRPCMSLSKDDVKTYSIFGYTWAFKENMSVARLTPDDNEARSDWWISNKAYFDGFIGQVERVPFDLSRQNMYEIPSHIYREFDEQKREIKRNKKEVDNLKEEMRKFRQELNVHPLRQENKEPIIVEQHYGLSDFRHVNSSYFNMGALPNFQTPIPSQPGSSDWQRQMPAQSATQYWQPGISSQPSSYYSFGHVQSHMDRPNLQTTIETHHDVDGIVDQEQFSSKYKLTPFIKQPHTTIVPKQLVNKTKNKGKKANLSPLNLEGAFEDDNVEENNVTFFGSQFTGNFLIYENVDPTKMKLLIRRRNAKANWKVAYTAKDELGQAYEKCRDIPLEQRDLIEIFLKTEAELDYQMNNALLLKAAKLGKQIRDKTAWCV